MFEDLHLWLALVWKVRKPKYLLYNLCNKNSEPEKLLELYREDLILQIPLWVGVSSNKTESLIIDVDHTTEQQTVNQLAAHG